MDKFDYDTKALERAENIIRAVLTASTDISTILPLLGYSNAEEALSAAERFGREKLQVGSVSRRSAVNDAKSVVAGLPAPALARFDRMVKRASSDGE